FVLFEQIVAPLARITLRCSVTVYAYNSVGVLDTVLGRAVVVVHDLIQQRAEGASLAARYVLATQAMHGRLGRPVCAASPHTLTLMRRLRVFRRSPQYLWSNPFYTFEAALARSELPAQKQDKGPLRVLLCSGMGEN